MYPHECQYEVGVMSFYGDLGSWHFESPTQSRNKYINLRKTSLSVPDFITTQIPCLNDHTLDNLPLQRFLHA